MPAFSWRTEALEKSRVWSSCRRMGSCSSAYAHFKCQGVWLTGLSWSTTDLDWSLDSHADELCAFGSLPEVAHLFAKESNQAVIARASASRTCWISVPSDCQDCWSQLLQHLHLQFLQLSISGGFLLVQSGPTLLPYP